MTKKEMARKEQLMPQGIPKYIRCYDNGGLDSPNGSFDQFTVVYSGKYRTLGLKRGERINSWFQYVAMSESPFSPQGFGMHGENQQQIDTIGKNGRGYVWPPAIGRKNHLGRRINFKDLPCDCKKLVLQDYKELWNIKE